VGVACGRRTGTLDRLDTDSLRSLIVANASEVVRLHKRVHETYRLSSRTPEHRERWETTCSEFRSRYDALAFPGGYSSAVARIVAGDSDAIEAGLCFVELRPYFYRSGYLFKSILPKLKRASLSAEQSQRLLKVLEAYSAWRESRRGAARSNPSLERP
jgi:hypothetical protein